MALEPGGVIRSRYVLERLLGQGAMAEIYLARDQQLARQVVLALLLPDRAADAVVRRRFLGEAALAARLQHPHRVEVYDVGEVAGRPFMVSEYLAGGSVTQLITREGPLPLGRAFAITQAVLAALGHAHAQGFAPRGVTADTVFLNADGQVKVADFGVAAPVVAAGATAGPADSLAPEYLAGGRGSAAADVYAVGVLLYDLLTGRRPVGAEPPRAQLAPGDGTSPPSQWRSDLPVGLDAVVLRALDRDPGQRYASATAMADALAAVKQPFVATTRAYTRPSDDHPAAAVPLPWRHARRRGAPLLLAAAVLGLVLLLVRAVGTGRSPSPHPEARQASTPIVATTMGTRGSASGAASPASSPSPAPSVPAPQAIATAIPRSATRAPVTTTPRPPSTPAPVATPPLASQVQSLQAMVVAALADGRIGPQGQDLLPRFTAISQALAQGDPHAAGDHLRDLSNRLHDLAQHGQIGAALAASLEDDVARLQEQLPTSGPGAQPAPRSPATPVPPPAPQPPPAPRPLPDG